ncbi:MAG: hypothetical protein ABH848_02785 [Candidatus Omnitrophota bacterium]
MLVNIAILSPTRTVFNGKGSVLTFPGEQGVFEVLGFHKRMMTRLISGVIFVDNKTFPLKRGMCKVDQNKVTVVIEEK